MPKRIKTSLPEPWLNPELGRCYDIANRAAGKNHLFTPREVFILTSVACGRSADPNVARIIARDPVRAATAILAAGVEAERIRATGLWIARKFVRELGNIEGMEVKSLCARLKKETGAKVKVGTMKKAIRQERQAQE